MNTPTCCKGPVRAIEVRRDWERPGYDKQSIEARLDDLMRRCREDNHQLVYQDLVDLRNNHG